MREVTTGGRLSFDGENLLLDGAPIAEETVIKVKSGEGQPLPGRVRRYPIKWCPTGWGIAHEDFIGHTYLNQYLDEYSIKDITILAIEEQGKISQGENKHLGKLGDAFGID